MQRRGPVILLANVVLHGAFAPHWRGLFVVLDTTVLLMHVVAITLLFYLFIYVSSSGGWEK